ncbi:hypothetical protein C9374_009038 [Naegleria lovaniensis]|uniref:Uncharacterized protein n=1 Tax=Naegleria lovaniensis TaxID=51637 RepID=A0AA88GHK3_NAELO|nr:uncharacterized protein C9374_009038 [Naegleria lovaniensis]KAG2377522.1 hypothetical protein C9374_009038 [Naegleria lovaniensis]
MKPQSSASSQFRRGLKFLSSEAMVVASPPPFFSSASFHQETNPCWKVIHSELYKLQNMVASCLGPCGQYKLIVDPNQNQLITKNGNQLLEFMKINNPVMKYLVSLFRNACSEYMDGTISCIILSYELLDLIMNEYFSKFHNVHQLCSDLYSFGEYMLNNTRIFDIHTNDRVHRELCIPIIISLHQKNQMELLPSIFKSLIANQIYNNAIVSNLVLNWLSLASRNFTQFETLSEYNLRIMKHIGKLEESRLLSNTIILENLFNLNVSFKTKPNLSMVSKFCIMSLACWEDSLPSQIAHDMNTYISKLDCHILLLVVQSNNNRKSTPIDLSHYPHLRRFIQMLNQKNILVFQYNIDDISSSNLNTQSNQGDHTSLTLLYHLIDLADLSGIVTNLQDEEFNTNYSCGSNIRHVKMNFKRGGQHCDLIIEFNDSQESTVELNDSNLHNNNNISYFTMIVKSLNHELLDQLEYQIHKCVKHLISIIKNQPPHSSSSTSIELLTCVIGGGCFETQFSKFLQQYRQDLENSNGNVESNDEWLNKCYEPSETLKLFSQALLRIPKQLLYNMIISSQQQNQGHDTFAQQHIHMLMQDLMTAGSMKYIQIPGNHSTPIKEIPKTFLNMFRESSQDTPVDICEEEKEQFSSNIPLESWDVKRHIVLSAINVVVNILRLDSIILD